MKTFDDYLKLFIKASPGMKMRILLKAAETMKGVFGEFDARNKEHMKQIWNTAFKDRAMLETMLKTYANNQRTGETSGHFLYGHTKYKNINLKIDPNKGAFLFQKMADGTEKLIPWTNVGNFINLNEHQMNENLRKMEELKFKLDPNDPRQKDLMDYPEFEKDMNMVIREYEDTTQEADDLEEGSP